MANRTVYNASLVMTADVKQAKSALEQLSNTLKNLVSSNIKGMSIGDTLTNDLLKAQQSAIQLQNILSKSTNINTGKLDLTKFSDSLKKAKLDLNDLYKSLSSFGVQGEKAFLSLTNQLMSAEIPLKRTSKLFDDLWITMKNTMKWQLTSSVMHSFVGTMKSAVGYAQDLNKSLNNIRIVTGYNVDQMAKFAKQANEAAKTLKTTTTSYTDASLIYYQQGLDTKAVKERTDATIKMANVTSESAKAVSDYMTAIWNNFDDGSKSLEYYADVMTALGAATASSTDEIAAGLEKFAAVSETVGLSYEYATAALATVTAETRQSADVVGNAFKTLFSRIQGLNLGETLDDGTTLNKYSSALAKVGVDIKETNGQIKDMDVILDELGSKWQTLSNDTQMALAQTVAGVRQYNQLISLMNSWDKFKINLDIAKDSRGTLNKQQEIYAESWEAASKKVKTSLEGIYDSVINDKAIIKITNGFANFLNLIENVSDSLGGMRGILFGLGAVVTKVFSKQMTESLNNMFYSFGTATGYHQMVGQQMRAKAIIAAENSIKDTVNEEADHRRLQVNLDNLKFQDQLLKVKQNITQEDFEALNGLTKINEVYGEILAKAIEIKQNSLMEQGANLNQLYNIVRNNGGNQQSYINAKDNLQKQIDAYNLFEYKNFDASVYANNSRGLIDVAKSLGINSKLFQQLEGAIQTAEQQNGSAEFVKEVQNLYEKLYQRIISKLTADFLKAANVDAKKHPEIFKKTKESVGQHVENYGRVKESNDNVKVAEENYKIVKEATEKAIQSSQRAAQTLGATVTGALNGITSLGYAINSLSSIKDVFNDDTLSNWEKMVRITTSLSFGLSGLINGFKGLSQIGNIGKSIGTAIQSYGEALLAQEKFEEAKASAVAAAATQAENAEGKEDIVVTTGQIAAEKGLEEQKEETAKSSLKEAGAQKVENAEGKEDIVVTTGQTVAEKGLTEAQKKALATILSKIKTLGWYALAIGAVAAIIYVLVKAYNADAEAAEKARKNLEEATQTAESAKQAYSDLLTSIENYNNAKSAIEDLTYGTQEWKDAIYEANQEVLALIKNYPILASYLDRDNKNGLLAIKPEGLDIVEQQAFQQKANAQNAQLLSEIIANNATNKSNITDAYRNNENYRTFKYEATTYNSNLDALNGGIKKETSGILLKDDYRKLVDLIIEDKNYLQKNSTEQIIDDLGLTVEKYYGKADSNTLQGKAINDFGEEWLTAFVDSIKNTPELFSELTDSVRSTIEANKIYAEQIIQNSFGENETYKNSLNKDALDTILSGNIDTEIIKNKANNLKNSIEDGKADSYYQEEYAKAMGYQHIKDKNNGKGVYLVNGEEKEISDEVIYQWYVLNDIIKQTTESLPALESTLEGLRQKALEGDADSQAAYSMVKTGSATAGVSIGQLETLQDNDKNIADFEKIYGEKNFEVIWTSMGFKNAQAYVDAFNNEVNNIEIPVFDEEYKENFDKLSLDAAKKIQETMEQLELGPAGEQAGQSFLDAFNKLFKSGLSQEAIEALAQIDWSKEGSLEEGKQILEDLGYNAENFSGYLEELAAQAYQLDFSVFEDLRKDLESIAGIISGLDLGSILSEEDYQLLSKYVDELENYFMLTSQGRKFIGTDEDADMIGEEAYKAGLEKLQQQQNAQSEVSDYGHDVNGTRVDANWSRYGTNGDWKDANLDRERTLQNILNNESKETLEAIGVGYGDWAGKNLNELQLSSEQIGKFFDSLTAMTSNPIDESTIHEYNQTVLGDSKNINEFDDNLNMVGIENTGLTPEQLENQRQYFQNLANEQAKAAQSYQELNQLMLDGEINQEAYQKGLVEQAKQYPELTDEIKEYNKIISDSSASSKEQEEAWGKLNNAFKHAKIADVAKDMKEAKKTMDDLTESMGDNAEQTDEYKESANKMANALNEAFGTESIDPTFVKENWEDISNFLETGSTKLYDKLAIKAAMIGTDIGDSLIADGTIDEKVNNIINNISALEGESFTISGSADMSNLLGGLDLAQTSAADLAQLLTNLAASGIIIQTEGLQKLIDTLKAAQGDLSAAEALEGQEEVTIQIGATSASKVPNGFSEDLQNGGYSGGGSGGGSGKSTGDSLQDTIQKRRDRRRELLGLKQEGLNPEDASKYYQEEIDLIEEENELLEEQIDMYKEQLPEAVEEFNDLVRSKGFGQFQLVLNDDGTVANLDAVLADLQSRWDYAELMEDTDLQNNLDEIYNALMGPLGIQENIDENVALIAKNKKEQAELALEDIVNRIDWRIKQIDYQIEKLNYYQEKLLIQAHGNKQTIEAMLEGFQYQEQEMLQLFEKGATLRQGIDELIAAKAQYPDYAQMFDEQILEYQSDLIDVNMDILELRAEMEELIQNVLEAALDEMDIQNERIDRYVSMLDRFQNIIDLSGRSILDQSLKVELGVAKLDTLINKMSISKQTMEGLAEATKLAQEALAKRTADDDETSVSFWENQVEMLEIELEKAQDDFLTNWEEVLEAAADIFDMRVELTVQTLEQALSPFSSLSVLEDRYNKEKDLQEKYLDDATKLYELNKLNRQVNQSITDENDLLAKSKLRDIQEEILAYQKAGVQMSQYDLDILQKKYDLRLAEIALMEAQNSKTSMRLIRDAAGNWTYAYDADQTAIDEALQSVEDATYELQKASTDYIDEMTEEMISIKQEFVEAIGDLDRNSTDYTEQLLYLQQHYMKEYNAVLGEFQKGVENAGLTIHDTWYGATLDLYNFEDAQKHFSDASDLAISELMVNYKDWQKVVEQAMGVAGTSWESFGDDTGATLDSLEEHIQALCDEISKLVDVLMEYVAMSIGMVEEWQSKYSKQVDAELAKNEAYMEMPGHGGNAGSSGSKGIDVSDISDFSSAMTYYIAMNGAKGFNDPYYQALKDARDKKIKEEGLEAVSTDRIDALLKNAASNGAATSSDYLGTDILVINPNTGNTYSSYTEDTVSAAENEKYTGKAEIVINFQLGDLGKYTGQGGRGAGISIATGYKSQPYIPVSIGNKTQSYSLTSNGKSTTTTSATSSGGPGSWDDPRSGWCSAWISDLMHYSGVADYVGGDAKVAVTNHNPSRWDYGDIADGTIVGSYGGKYGHIGIVSGGLIYSTSNTGNTLDAMTPEEYERVYGALYTTSEVSTEAAKNAEYVYKRENGIPTVDIPEQTVVESQNIKTPAVRYNRFNMIPMLYDTGGYTGMWGPQGKWALLHEKELVLNKADTSNILDAVKISRGVDDKISDMIAFTNNSLRDLLSYVKLPIFETQPIEQTVQIQAEFPGVTDQYEIQEALSNLSNDASQYLNIQRNFW